MMVGECMKAMFLCMMTFLFYGSVKKKFDDQAGCSCCSLAVLCPVTLSSVKGRGEDGKGFALDLWGHGY